MNAPEQLKYNQQDLWVQIDGGAALCGVTDYAQDQLSDVVYVEIKVTVGETVARGQLIGVVESVKASSDIESPLTGKVLAINEDLQSSPEWINADPYGRAWLVRLQPEHGEEVNTLLSAAEYAAYRAA